MKRAVEITSLALLLLAVRGTAHADEMTPEARARVHFQQGVEAVQHGELTRAAEQFEAAQALRPNPVVLYNLGQTYSALGRPVEAEKALRSYLTTEPRPTDPQRIKAVEELIAFNVRRIGSVVVELTPPDATLEVDGSPALPTPPGRIRLAAGRHVFVATKPEYEPAIANVDVSAGVEIHARLELAPSPASAAAPAAVRPPTATGAVTKPEVPVVDPAASPPPPQGKSTRYVLALGAIGVGGAAIVASAVFALEANWLNHASNRDGHCDDTGCDPEGMHLREAAKRNGNWATGLFVSGAVVGAVGVTLYLLEPRPEPRHAKAALPRSNMAVRLGPTDVTVAVRF